MNGAVHTGFDITIVGGGMVGASLAVTLLPLNLKVALVEAAPLESGSQPSFDERTTALSNGSRNVLTGIGLWSALAAHATPIRRIHVSDRGRFGFARIDAAEQGVEAMGYVLPNRVLGAALWQRLKAHGGFELLCPAVVEDIHPGPDEARIRLQGGRELTTRLLIAADGAHSIVRKALGVTASTRDYGQTAVVTIVSTSNPHGHVAYERFTPEGPIAILPVGPSMNDNRCAVIWTLAPEEAQQKLKLSDEAFLRELQQAFGFRLGRFLRVGRRGAYPLALTEASERVRPRCAIIGNAAQGLHPIAGQGFNLGLRDVATLAEVIADAVREGEDIGGEALLRRYDDWRRRDRRGIIAFTDGLVRLFGSRRPTVRAARNLGLLLFDLTPPAKDALSRLSLGFAGRLPRLARGAELR